MKIWQNNIRKSKKEKQRPLTCLQMKIWQKYIRKRKKEKQRLLEKN